MKRKVLAMFVAMFFVAGWMAVDGRAMAKKEPAQDAPPPAETAPDTAAAPAPTPEAAVGQDPEVVEFSIIEDLQAIFNEEPPPFQEKPATRR